MGTLDRRGAVFILTLGDDENRFHPDRLAVINAALDEVESADAPKAVVTTGVGKFYSNGLDLDFMSSNPDAAESNLRDVHALLARVLAFPAPIVSGSRATRLPPGRCWPWPTTCASCAAIAATSACPRWTSASRSQPE